MIKRQIVLGCVLLSALSAWAQTANEYLQQAYAQRDLGESRRAESYYWRALTTDDQSVAAYEGLIALYLTQNRLADARPLATTLRALPGLSGTTWLQLARFDEADGAVKTARASYEKAYALSATDPAIVQALAYFYSSQGEMAKADALLPKVEALMPAVDPWAQPAAETP